MPLLFSIAIHAVHRREVVRTSGRRTTLLGRYPHHEESSVCMAIVVAKRQPPGQPHVAHTSSKPVWQVRTRPRRRHMDNRGGPSSTSPWRSRGTEVCMRDRHSANEDGWFGFEVSNQMRSGGVSGVVGRRLGHDQPEKPRGRQLGGADHGGRIAVPTRRLFGWSSMPAPVSTAKASWPELRDGKRPRENTTGEPGEWQHGWQSWASSVSDSYHAVSPFRSVSSAPSVTLKSQRRRCPGFRSDSSGACHSHREASTPAPCGRGGVLWLPRSSGPSGAPQSRMHPHWQTQEACDPDRP